MKIQRKPVKRMTLIFSQNSIIVTLSYRQLNIMTQKNIKNEKQNNVKKQIPIKNNIPTWNLTKLQYGKKKKKEKKRVVIIIFLRKEEGTRYTNFWTDTFL